MREEEKQVGGGGGLCVCENRRVRRGRARQVGLAGTAATQKFHGGLNVLLIEPLTTGQ
jgi:hypothetical protein